MAQRETILFDIMDKTESFVTGSFRPSNPDGVFHSFVPVNGSGFNGWRFYAGQHQNTGPFRH